MQDLLQRLTLFSEQNSYSLNNEGLRKMATLLIDSFSPLCTTWSEHPLQTVERISLDGKTLQQTTGPLLRFQRGSSPLLFVGHYDTVHPPELHFPVREKQGFLHGPGVADMKGGIAMLWQLLQEEPIPFDLVLVPDEEIGSKASTPLLKEFAQKKKGALVLEPRLPSGAFVSTRPASLTGTLLVQGEPAHIGRHPEKGKSAIVALCQLLQQLSYLHAPEQGSSFNAGQIQGGTAVNTVPEIAVAKINIRSQENLNEVQDVVHLLIQEIEERHNVTITWQQDSYRPAKAFPKKLFTLLEEVATHPIQTEATGGVTDGNTLEALGIPTIDTFGPIGHFLHTPEEKVDIASIFATKELLKRFVLAFGVVA